MRRIRGFSLIEIMIAMVFITIGFFGYVALHSRILHSGQRLEEREVIRSGTDFFEAIEVSRITLGMKRSIDTSLYPVDSEITGLHPISTMTQGRDTSWKSYYPEVYHPGLEETMETGATVLENPYEYSWEKR